MFHCLLKYLQTGHHSSRYQNTDLVTLCDLNKTANSSTEHIEHSEPFEIELIIKKTKTQS